MQEPPFAVPSRPGFLLVEGLIGIVLFGMFVGAVGFTFLMMHESALEAGDVAKASFLSEMALEAASGIRDEGFSSLTAGTHGVAIGPDGTWTLSGSVRETADGFRTVLEISAVTETSARVAARTSWNQGSGRSGSVLLTADFGDWRSQKLTGDWSTLTPKGEYVASETARFTAAARAGDTLFVGSETGDGGAGLYLFDISDENSPQRLASSFDLGHDAYDVALKGETLYVLTADPSAELKAYDVSAPASFSAGSLVTSYDLPGDGRGRTLWRTGSLLYVGATDDAAEAQLYALWLPTPSTITLTGSLLDPGGTMYDLALADGQLYVGNGNNVSELRVVDVRDPQDLRLAAGSGYNLTDVQDGLAVAVTGTSALVGRASGEAIEELVLFETASGSSPVPPPGPWYHEVGGRVNALTFELGGDYVFLASDFADKELQVVSPSRLQNGLSPEVEFYDVDTGEGRGLLYDPWSDRLFLLTTLGVHIFGPDDA